MFIYLCEQLICARTPRLITTSTGCVAVSWLPNPTPQVQTAGGDYGRDISKCNPGCDYTTGYRCCKEKCQDIELSCDA